MFFFLQIFLCNIKCFWSHQPHLNSRKLFNAKSIFAYLELLIFILNFPIKAILSYKKIVLFFRSVFKTYEFSCIPLYLRPHATCLLIMYWHWLDIDLVTIVCYLLRLTIIMMTELSTEFFWNIFKEKVD